MILIVTLDLRGPATAYDPLYQALKGQGRWWHYMRWTWLVDTQRTPDEVVDALKPHVQSNDRVLVSPLVRPYQGLLTKEAWDWIRARMPRPKEAS